MSKVIKSAASLRRGLVVGLSGVSCGGKTTIAKLIEGTLRWTRVVHQDGYFHPNESKYHVLIPHLNHFDWEQTSAVDLPRMERDVLNIIEKNEAAPPPARFFPNSSFVSRHLPPQSVVSALSARYSSTPVTLLEGHILFNHAPLASLCNLKFFLTLDEQECRRRRLERVYDPPNPEGFFDAAVWPAYLRRLQEVKESNPPGTIDFIDAKTTPLDKIYRHILTRIVDSLDAINKSQAEEEQRQQESEHLPSASSGTDVLAPSH